jgi:hypothetical protein
VFVTVWNTSCTDTKKTHANKTQIELPFSTNQAGNAILRAKKRQFSTVEETRVCANENRNHNVPDAEALRTVRIAILNPVLACQLVGERFVRTRDLYEHFGGILGVVAILIRMPKQSISKIFGSATDRKKIKKKTAR